MHYVPSRCLGAISGRDAISKQITDTEAGEFVREMVDYVVTACNVVPSLLDTLEVMPTGRVVIGSNGPVTPARVTPVGRDDVVHVIMPIHKARRG